MALEHSVVLGSPRQYLYLLADGRSSAHVKQGGDVALAHGRVTTEQVSGGSAQGGIVSSLLEGLKFHIKHFSQDFEYDSGRKWLDGVPERDILRAVVVLENLSVELIHPRAELFIADAAWGSFQGGFELFVIFTKPGLDKLPVPLRPALSFSLHLSKHGLVLDVLKRFG